MGAVRAWGWALELRREAAHLQGRAPAAGFQSRALSTHGGGRRQSGVQLALQRSHDPVPCALPPRQLPRSWGSRGRAACGQEGTGASGSYVAPGEGPGQILRISVSLPV